MGSLLRYGMAVAVMAGAALTAVFVAAADDDPASERSGRAAQEGSDQAGQEGSGRAGQQGSRRAGQERSGRGAQEGSSADKQLAAWLIVDNEGEIALGE